MILSAAERQKRSRENKKAKVAELKAFSIREIVEKRLAESNNTNEMSDYAEGEITVDELLSFMAHPRPTRPKDDDGRDLLLHVLKADVAEALYLSVFSAFADRDPWPELTVERLAELVGTSKGRLAKADQLGFVFRGEVGYGWAFRNEDVDPTGMRWKWIAHRNREWLEAEEKKRKNEAVVASLTEKKAMREGAPKLKASRVKKAKATAPAEAPQAEGAVANYAEKAEGFGRF